MAENNHFVFIGIAVAAVLAGIIGLICSSYADLHYYEIGFVKSKTTGAVDTSKVWFGGRRWIGPDKTFKIFDSSAHYIDLYQVSVFAKPDQTESDTESSTPGAALAVDIGVQIVYFIVAADLKQLHDEYDVNYEALMTSSAQAALKDTASLYQLSEFYSKREEVELALLEGVQRRLGGACCPSDCSVSNCWAGCKPRNECTTEDKGLFVEARYLQMTNLEIPKEVEQRNLRTLLLTEETAKESFTQQAAIIEKETEQIVDRILNSAKEVNANATAQSQLIAAKSQANYQKTLEDARRTGLVELFSSIGLNDIEQKNSFDYLRSLGDNSNAHLTVDFDQLIMGPTKLP